MRKQNMKPIHPGKVLLEDYLKPLGMSIAADDLLGEILSVPVSRIGALLPFAMMILILMIRPRGLLGTRDT